MIHNFSITLADYCCTKGLCKEEEKAWVLYRVEILLGKVVTYPLLLIVALVISIFNRRRFSNSLFLAFTASIILLAVLMIFRKVIGGYHAKSHRNCLLLSLTIYAGALIFLAPLLTFSHAVCISLFLVCGALIFRFAPFIHPNLVQTQLAMKNMRLVSRVLYVCVALVVVVCIWLGLPFYLVSHVTSGMLIAVLTMFAGKLNEKGGRKNGCN